MRFLYLSMSVFHACSSPSRQARTRRSSLHPTCGPGASSARPPSFSRRATGSLLMPVQLLDVPERVVIENGGTEIPESLLGADQYVGTDQEDEWQILRDQLLHFVVEPLARVRINRRQLTAHQRVDFRFPRRRRLLLFGRPQMRRAARQPHVHFRVRTAVGIPQPEDA